VPTVALDRLLPNAHSITIDDLEGGRIGTQHLLSLGHRRIGLLLREIERTSGSERLLGYCQALANSHIAYDESLVIACTDTDDCAYQAAWRLLRRPDRPTALFADNDRVTLGAMRAVYDAGLRIPDQISIVGYGTSSLADTFAPPLTSITAYPYRLGTVAAQTVLRLIDQQTSESASVTMLPVALIARASTAPPPNRS
jgi:DNA-binding LacI/PurR family transcriptional regulator